MKMDNTASLDNRVVRASVLALALVATVGVAGCATDVGGETGEADPANETGTGEVIQAFSDGYFETLSRSDNLPASANSKHIAGPGYTCFLSGIGGSLYSAGGAPGSGNGNLYTTSEASVDKDSSGNWSLYVRTGTSEGNRLRASAMCVNSTVGLTAEVSWSSGQSRKQLAAYSNADPNRRCFLTRVANTDQAYSNSKFNSSGDEVHVYSDELGRWWIDGSGDAAGSARCIHVNDAYNAFGQVGSANKPVVINNGSTQCALRKVMGTFRSNDYDAGVFLTYNSLQSQYYLKTTSGRGAEVMCFF